MSMGVKLKTVEVKRVGVKENPEVIRLTCPYSVIQLKATSVNIRGCSQYGLNLFRHCASFSLKKEVAASAMSGTLEKY